MKTITNEIICKFKQYLKEEEKAGATIEKYIRDVQKFMRWLCGRKAAKAVVLDYKQALILQYAPASVNSVLSSLNSFFVFCEWFDCRVRTLKIQKRIFAKKERELTKAEYDRLLTAAKNKKSERMYLLMQTICSTGIRVSEDI